MNIAFIDGQNLHLGTWGSDLLVEKEVMREEDRWKIDYVKFREYLREKYSVKEAYYYIGCMLETNESLYDNLQKAGFIVRFKRHNESMISKKKGNVDADIIFDMMKFSSETKFDKIILVSGDGDYKKTTDHLIEKDRFEKILFPNKSGYSSLCNGLGDKYFAHLEDIKETIEYKK